MSAEGRRLCQRLKASDPRWLPHYAGQVAEFCARERRFANLFAADAWLVPVPGHAPACGRRAAAFHLAMALHELGLALQVWPGIARCVAVTRSATALPGERPTVRQHYESFAIAAATRPPPRLVLVDDVITKGRTLLAAAAKLRDAFPSADVRAFAMVRSTGFLNRLDRLLAPCEGVVYWTGRDARREP
jgi:predicted amidophosphoribosyltransferase